jgi:flagellar biosynthesis component FlhA
MAVKRDSIVPVVVELGASLNALPGATRQDSLEHRLSSKLGELVERVGLVGAPAVEVQSKNSARALRVRVHGVLQPYSSELMKRVWRAVAPEPLRSLPEAVSSRRDTGFPDAWLKQYVSGAQSSNQADWALSLEYVTELAFEIIRQRPSCLVGQAQVTAYLDEASPPSAKLQAPLCPETLTPVLKSLLHWGVQINDKHELLQEVRNVLALGRPVGEAIEAAFARLRSNRIEIHVHPLYFDALLGGEPPHEPRSIYVRGSTKNTAEPLRVAEEALFYELGLVLPDVVWLPSTETSEGMIAIKVNDQLQAAQPGLKTGEVLVNAPLDQLKVLGVQGRSCTHPVNGSECAVIAEIDRNAAESAGFRVWSPIEFVALVLYGEVSRLAECLLSMEDVEGQLAELDSSFPELTRAAAARFSLEDLTRVLRGLLREKISIRNLRGILEQLLRYDTVRIDSRRYIVMDDRLPTPEGATGPVTSSWLNYREFVRMGLKDLLMAKYTHGRDTLVAFLVAPEIEARAEAMLTSLGTDDSEIAFDEALQESLCDLAWKALGSARPAAQGVVILTGASARAGIREIIAPELPDLAVISYSELRAGLSIQPVAKLG